MSLILKHQDSDSSLSSSSSSDRIVDGRPIDGVSSPHQDGSEAIDTTTTIITTTGLTATVSRNNVDDSDDEQFNKINDTNLETTHNGFLIDIQASIDGINNGLQSILSSSGRMVDKLDRFIERMDLLETAKKRRREERGLRLASMRRRM